MQSVAQILNILHLEAIVILMEDRGRDSVQLLSVTLVIRDGNILKAYVSRVFLCMA